MNLYTQLSKKATLSLLAAMLFASLFIFVPQASAQGDSTSGRDPVVKYCTEKVKKASAKTCQNAATEARNKASWQCEKAKRPDSCIRDKAKVYIKKAAKGASSDAKFRSNLEKILKKIKGSSSKPSPKAGARAAETTEAGGITLGNGVGEPKDQCGSGNKGVDIKFDIGCQGDEYDGSGEINPIVDMAYALIRFLSIGVGVVVVASIIYAGIQYSSSQGNAESTQAAKNRVQNAIIALVFYMFIFSIVQFLVPGGLFGAVVPTPPFTAIGVG